MKRTIPAMILILFLGMCSVSAQENELKSKHKITFYGFVKFESIYDNTEVAKGDWLLFASPGNSASADQSIFSMNARHTRFGFKFNGLQLENGGKILGLIETDFAGGFPNSSTAARQPLLRLRHAWVELNYPTWEARFGQDWALISGPFPNTTSFVVGAGKGNLWMRIPQIKYTVKNDNFKFALSLNRPMAGNNKYDDNAGGDFDIVSDGERSAKPWVMGRFWVNNNNLTFSASGHYGSEQINDTNGNPHDNKTYSLNADLIFKTGAMTFTGRAFTGENLNTFFGGVFQGFTKTVDAVENISSVGGWGQAVYKVDDNWSYTLGGGLDNPDDDDLTGNMRSKNSWIFTNVTRNITSSFSMMMEYNYLKTDYTQAESGKNSRFQFVTYYKF